MSCRRPFGLAVVILLAVLCAQVRKSRPRAVVRGPGQELLLVLVPDHADHAAGLHLTIIQGVLTPPPLPGSAHHSQQQGPRADDVIVVCSDSDASCSAQGSVALDRSPDAMTRSAVLASLVSRATRCVKSSSSSGFKLTSPARSRCMLYSVDHGAGGGWEPQPSSGAQSAICGNTGLVATCWFVAAIVMLRVLATARTSRSRKAPAVPRVGGLVLGVLLTLARTGSAFSTKSSLVVALDEWCTNAANALTTHGHISTWDVSVITDFSFLVTDAPCSSTFDEDLNAWDVGRVTTLKARRCVCQLEGRGLGCSRHHRL